MTLRLALLALLLAPAVGAQNLFTPYGQTSLGLSVVAAVPVSGDADSDDVALGVSLSGGVARGTDASLSVVRTPGGSRDVTTTALGAAVYLLNRDGLRVGPTLGFQHSTDGRSTLTSASLGAVAARQIAVGAGLLVPRANVTATSINGGGGIQGSGGVAVAGVLPVGRTRILVEPALGFSFRGGAGAGSVRGGLIVSL